MNIANVESDPGDYSAALVDLHKALDISRGLVGKDPNAVDAQTVIGGALYDLASIPGSGVSWAEVAAHYQGMKQRGQLRADMNDQFADTLRRAAEEAKAKK